MKKILDSSIVWWFIGIIFPLATFILMFRSLSDVYPNPFDTFDVVLWWIIGAALLIICIKHFIFDDLFNEKFSE